MLAIVALAACGMVRGADGDPVTGKRKTVTCIACHGVSGFKSMPKLGGSSAGYVVEALRACKSGKRAHPTMRDIADLAAHYAGMPRVATASEVAAPASGERCVVCHGAQGDQPAAPEVPIIAGQGAAYIVQVVREYRDGKRVHAVMQEQLREVGGTEIAGLAAFFAGRSAQSVK